MATYVISDIHGCYEEYMALLKQIQLTDTDTLYILGDAMDRGPEPIRVIYDIMARKNAFYILGNHDLIMLFVMHQLAPLQNQTKNTSGDWVQPDGRKILQQFLDLSSDDPNATLEDKKHICFGWLEDGGKITLQQFLNLSSELQNNILDYLDNAFNYKKVDCNGKQFILVHAGICHFDENKPLKEYSIYDFVSKQPNYQQRYFSNQNTYLVTGHTPTPFIRADKAPLVYQDFGHIAIDCGCVFGGRLAAYCLETGQVTYVNSNQRYPDDIN